MNSGKVVSEAHPNLLGGLEEGGKRIPFWDDVNLSELSELSKNAMLIEVIENPLRFWFGIVVPAQAATVRRAKAMGQLPGR